MNIILYLLLIVTVAFSSQTFEIKYFEDKNSHLNIYDINTNQFKDLNNTKFGFSESTFWFKLKIQNTDSGVKIFEFLDSRLDEAYLYDDTLILKQSMGDKIPFTNREFNDPNIAFTLQTNKTYFIKVLNTSKVNVEYKIWEEDAYLTHMDKKNILKGVYFGALIIMLLYNMIIYIFLRQRVFLEYVIYHLSLAYVMIYYTGVSAQLFFPNAANLDASTVYIHAAALCTIMATQFFRSFVNTATTTPRIDKVLLSFMLLHAFLAFLSIFHLFYHLNHIIFNLTMMILSIFLLWSSLYIYIKQKNATALFYFFAWLIMMVGIVLTSLTLMNLIPRNDFTTNMFQFGSLFEILLLSMGLSYRYKVKQDELLKKNVIIQEQAKMVAMGEMLQNIAHQWRQPLSEINAVAMKIDADYYKNNLTSEVLNNELERIENITEHMSSTIESFNTYFSKNKTIDETTIRDIIDKSLRIIEAKITKNKIDLDIYIDSDVKFKTNSGELIQVLLVILNNAIEVLDERNSINKAISIKYKYVNKKHLISFEDNAGGVSNEIIKKIFDPYFSTKFKSNGIGIGLYMAKTLIEDSMKGKLSVSNTKNGAKFLIEL